MPAPNRRATIPKVFTASGKELSGIDIPFRESNKAFFDQKFYCAGTDSQGNPCGALAAAKTKYTRNKGRSPVSGNFHLASESVHIEACRFDIAAQAHELHIQHQDTLEKVNNLYRLTIPGTKVTDVSKDAAPGRLPTNNPPQVLHTTHKTGRRKAIYQRIMQTAVAILKLLDQFDNDEEAKNLFRIKYGDSTYVWKQFFYSAETDADRLYTAAKHDKSRPMVLYGRVGKVQKNKVGGNSIWVFNGAKAKVPGSDEVINLYIHTDDAAAERLMRGDKILTIGKWEIGRQTKYLSTKATADTYTTYS